MKWDVILLTFILNNYLLNNLCYKYLYKTTMFIIIDYRIFGLTFKNIIQEQSKPIFAKLFATITPMYQS